MSDEICELSLQLYLPLTALIMNYDQSNALEAGEKALEMIEKYHLIRHLDTKISLDVFAALFDDPESLNEQCFQTLVRHYFLSADGKINNESLSDWLCAKGIALLYRYTDETRYLQELIDHVTDHLAIGKNVITMLSKDDSFGDVTPLIELIQKLCEADHSLYALQVDGLDMLKHSQMETHLYCELANKLAYGLLTVNGHQEKLLKRAKQTLDEIEKLLHDAHEIQDVSLYAKIKSNQGAYEQAEYKLHLNSEDMQKAVAYHKEALEIRVNYQLPEVSQSLMTLASDYYYVYRDTHQIDDLKISLNYHLQAYQRIKDQPDRYKNLTRIAGTRIELDLASGDDRDIEQIYDDLDEATVLARAQEDTHELRNIEENFKDSLELFKNKSCPAALYNKIYRLAENVDQENGYLCDLVRRYL